MTAAAANPRERSYQSAKRSDRTLVLNADYRPIATYPIQITTPRDAVKLILKGRADLVEDWGTAFASERRSLPTPKVVALREFRNVYSKPKFCRRSVLLRDHFTCFAAGTRILMADGRQMPIELMNVGDRVIDAFGHPTTVVRMTSRKSTDCVMIKHRGSYERTTVTTDHPFLTGSNEFTAIGDVPIEERRGGGMLRFPREICYELPKSKMIDMTTLADPKKWLRVRGGRISLSKHSHATTIPVTVRQSADLAYLLGLYVAEGSASVRGGIVFSLHIDERDTLAADVIRIMNDVFGIPMTFRHYTGSNGCTVTGSNYLLADILRRLCGKGARNKKTPWDLIGPFHADYLRGLFSGDGCVDKVEGSAAIGLVSFDAILDAQSMLWGLGIYPSLHRGDRPNRLPALGLSLKGQNRTMFMRRVMNVDAEDCDPIFGDATHVFRRLQERKSVDGETVVYNLEVEGSHTYIANGLAVHNCQYCGVVFPAADLSYDHVVPRARGGRTVWANIVMACFRCNGRKGHRTTREAGMHPIRAPREPTAFELLRAGLAYLPAEIKEDFGSYLYWNQELAP